MKEVYGSLNVTAPPPERVVDPTRDPHRISPSYPGVRIPEGPFVPVRKIGDPNKIPSREE